ncbi:MAG: flagellar filament capping protein FliD [Peptostreptococcaceae bacterium]|nr:flagellar filament capping protein FliD [Peptostreptococcaceae bacterium]
MSSGINFLGSYSGIDQSTIDSLMEMEKLPLVQMASQKTEYESKQDAWRDINTRLDSLMTKVRDIQYDSVYEGKAATSTDSGTVSAAATAEAMSGTYEIVIGRIATSSRIIGAKVLAVGETNDTALGIAGSFTITNGDGLFETVMVEATDTLSTIVGKINNLNDTLEVAATVVDGRLVLKDDNKGARTLTLADAAGTPLASLGLDVVDPLVTSETGLTAQFSINGIDIERDTNEIDDAVVGLTITLGAETNVGDSKIITVSNNTAQAIEKVEAFIAQYNSTLAFLQEKSDAGDSETAGSAGSAGTLAGDSTLQRIISRLRTMASSSFSGLDSKFSNASQLGITTIDKEGQLQLNSSKLTDALVEDAKAVKNFFHDTDAAGNEIGLTANLENYINSLIATGTGITEVRADGLQRSLDTLSDRIDAFTDRMETRETYYIRIFTRLDVALQQAESQMSMLTGQLDSLSGL